MVMGHNPLPVWTGPARWVGKWVHSRATLVEELECLPTTLDIPQLGTAQAFLPPLDTLAWDPGWDRGRATSVGQVFRMFGLALSGLSVVVFNL